MKSTSLTLLFYTIGVYALNTFGATCRHGEYLSKVGECCPMCNKGFVVLRDCIGDYSTICAPCTKGTFMNVRNRLYTCFLCKTCDRGLYILQNCSTIKDTVCEVLDGYYCVQHSDGECSLAMKHSECKPGEQIITPGNKSSDTVCEACPLGFYSPKGVRCFKWNDCSLNNEIVDEEGTSITDVKCKSLRKRFGLIAAFVLIAAFLLLLLSSCLRHSGHTSELCSVLTSIFNLVYKSILYNIPIYIVSAYFPFPCFTGRELRVNADFK
ncbi:tumor necrosis factor receptor superfamily member 14-like isoform X2 [Silurus meridionalis]|uniref:tumor necrosis factor receptor superfamily member 14-like isoform X2 n=2 Tax=Silurus meridionalis TaxID=175797 RepID=UPI001EEB46F8|nr:tumor necrosis factor receptor superfamily member 14-like isoform X2 [Silurus meridionalis]